MIRLTVLLMLTISSFFISSCTQPAGKTLQSTEKAHETPNALSLPKQQITTVPAKVIQVLEYIRSHHTAPAGYVGSRHFGNFEGRLPETDSAGKRVNYQEWDVNPHQKGVNRGAERLITGSDSSAYYTPNHYQSFITVKDAN